MWNWKTVYEDDRYAFYCDLDNIIDTAGNEEGLCASTECYMPLPERCGIWTSLFLKKKTAKKRYVAAREKGGFSIAGYEDYHYSLCLVEFDRKNTKYRVIPAADYDEKDQQIGESTLLDAVSPPLIDGVTVDWSNIRSRKTHTMIKALYKMFFA
jgi:hypothetical protein